MHRSTPQTESARIRRFLPRQTPMSALERLVAVVGALAGIGLTAIALAILGLDPELPLIIAPMGASAVLVFAVPSSPLAQPWSVIGGNGLSALAGVLAVQLVPDPTLAAAVAVAGAVLLMSLGRCVHPPGGAVALTAVVGGPVIQSLGFGYALAPVLTSSALLVLVGLAYNNGVRRSYPHEAPATPRASAPMTGGLVIERRDVEAALASLDEKLQLEPEDLEALVLQVMLEAEARIKRGDTAAVPAVEGLQPGGSGS